MQVFLGLLQEGAPGGHGLLDAEPQEGESGFRHDRSRYGGGRGGDDRGEDRGEDVPRHDGERGNPDEIRILDVFPALYGEHLGANDPRDVHPGEDADDQNDGEEALFKEESEDRHHDEPGDGEEDIDEAHEEAVDESAEIAGEHADGDSDQDRAQHGEHADEEGNLAAVEYAREVIPSHVVGSEPVQGARGLELMENVDLIGIQAAEEEDEDADEEDEEQVRRGKSSLSVTAKLQHSSLHPSVFCPSFGLFAFFHAFPQGLIDASNVGRTNDGQGVRPEAECRSLPSLSM